MQFLDLPPKIRVRIYKSLLHQEKPIEPLLPNPIRKYFKALSGPTTRLNAGFNLLLFCASINRGCCRILYRSNTFHLRSRHADEVWPSALVIDLRLELCPSTLNASEYNLEQTCLTILILGLLRKPFSGMLQRNTGIPMTKGKREEPQNMTESRLWILSQQSVT